MNAAGRRALRERFDYRCGYCGAGESDVGAELTVDHFQPRSRGGTDTPDNLVYCCHACNEFKGDFWAPESPQRLLHPLRDTLADHLVLDEDDRLRGLTPTGAFHLERLQLNRPALIQRRQARRIAELARSEREEVRARLRELQERLERLEARMLREDPDRRRLS